MNDPLQLGVIGLILSGVVAAVKLIEWYQKSDPRAIQQAGRWGAVGLFAVLIPLLIGLAVNRRWVEAIALSVVMLIGLAFYGPRILGQSTSRRTPAPDPTKRHRRGESADEAPDEAEMVQRSIAVLEDYLRRTTGAGGQGMSDSRTSPSQITDARAQGVGNGSHTELPSSLMSEAEALAVLGLPPDAKAPEINEAHRRLMQMFHPDRGGSEYFAVKVNQAKETLLELRAQSGPNAGEASKARSRRDSNRQDLSQSKSASGR